MIRRAWRKTVAELDWDELRERAASNLSTAPGYRSLALAFVDAVLLGILWRLAGKPGSVARH